MARVMGKACWARTQDADTDTDTRLQMSAGNGIVDVYGSDVETLSRVRTALGEVKKGLAALNNPVEGVLKASISLRKARAEGNEERAAGLEATVAKKQAQLDAAVETLEALKASFPAAGEADSTDPSKAAMIDEVVGMVTGGAMRGKKDFMDFSGVVRTHTQALFKEMGAFLTLIKELKAADSGSDDGC